MLEIYNETIRDLLATNRSSSDTLRTENGTAGKQYTIKHDANGNSHVSDLTIVDVRSANEVSFLLERAAHSRLLNLNTDLFLPLPCSFSSFMLLQFYIFYSLGMLDCFF